MVRAFLGPQDAVRGEAPTAVVQTSTISETATTLFYRDVSCTTSSRPLLELFQTPVIVVSLPQETYQESSCFEGRSLRITNVKKQKLPLPGSDTGKPINLLSDAQGYLRLEDGKEQKGKASTWPLAATERQNSSNQPWLQYKTKEQQGGTNSLDHRNAPISCEQDTHVHALVPSQCHDIAGRWPALEKSGGLSVCLIPLSKSAGAPMGGTPPPMEPTRSAGMQQSMEREGSNKCSYGNGVKDAGRWLRAVGKREQVTDQFWEPQSWPTLLQSESKSQDAELKYKAQEFARVEDVQTRQIGSAFQSQDHGECLKRYGPHKNGKAAATTGCHVALTESQKRVRPRLLELYRSSMHPVLRQKSEQAAVLRDQCIEEVSRSPGRTPSGVVDRGECAGEVMKEVVREAKPILVMFNKDFIVTSPVRENLLFTIALTQRRGSERVDLHSEECGLQNVLVGQFTAFSSFLRFELGGDALRVKYEQNAGGSSTISESLSMEYFARRFQARDVVTEMEVEYQSMNWKKVDYICTLYGQRVGVSVTRAMSYPDPEAFTTDAAYRLLYKKLHGLVVARHGVTKRHSFLHCILHVWCETQRTAEFMQSKYRGVLEELDITNDVVMVLTVAEGMRARPIFYEQSLSET